MLERSLLAPLTPETPPCIRPWSVSALVVKQCFRTYDIPRRGTGVVCQKIETGPVVTKCRSDRSQCLASHGKLARRKTVGEQLERIHVGQAIRLDFHCRKSVPEKWRAKKRPGSVKFRLGGGAGNQRPPWRCRRHEYAAGPGCDWPPN
jgi:hypothetical protein